MGINIYNQKDFEDVMPNKEVEVKRVTTRKRYEITDSQWERLKKYFP
jgi:hypothetical protein